MIDQKENLDILLKRNGSTKVTVNSTGADVNCVITADAVSTTDVQTNEITAVDYFATTMAGSGDRPVYVDNSGQLYASDVNEGTHYVSYPGAGFSYDEEYSQYDMAYGQVFYNNVGHVKSMELGDFAQCLVHLPEGAVVTSLMGGFNDVLSDAV